MRTQKTGINPKQSAPTLAALTLRRMIPAAALHTTVSFDAIPAFERAASILAGDFDEFRAILRGIIGAFGAPHDLYQDTALFKDTWRDLTKVVAALECFLRRLLLMLAAQDTRPLKLRPPRPSQKRGKRAPAPAGFKGGRPAFLRAHFAAAPPTPCIKSKPRQSAKPNRDTLYVSAYGLAARLEALIRTYANPEKAALRLRRRLARHALKRQLCVRMMAEPSHLAQSHPPLASALRDIEADTLAANATLLAKPPD